MTERPRHLYNHLWCQKHKVHHRFAGHQNGAVVGCPHCNKDNERASMERAYQKAWNTDYWKPGNPIWEHYHASKTSRASEDLTHNPKHDFTANLRKMTEEYRAEQRKPQEDIIPDTDASLVLMQAFKSLIDDLPKPPSVKRGPLAKPKEDAIVPSTSIWWWLGPIAYTAILIIAALVSPFINHLFH